MRKSLLAIVLAAGALCAPVARVEAQTPENAGLGIRLLEAPRDRANDPRAKIYVIDHLRPGTQITRKFEVANSTPRPLSVVLYPGAATITGGSFAPAEGRGANDLTRWTTVTPEKVDLAPSARTTATFTIKVPDDAPDRERYGLIWAEVPPPPDQVGVRTANRVGIRMYLSVGAGAEPKSDFVIENLTAARDQDGRPLVKARVKNTGERALDMAGSLRLEDGPGGVTAGPFPAELGTTLGIGEAQPVTVRLGQDLPAGPWRAALTLQSGELTKKVEATITFPSGREVEAEPVEAREVTGSARGRIALGLAILLLLGALVLLFRLWRRRSVNRSEEASSR